MHSGSGLSRRKFVIRTAALSAGILASAIASPAADAPTTAPARPIRIAVNLDMIAGASILDRFKIAKEAGLQGIEIDSPGSWKLDEVLAARDATGVAVCGTVDSVHWYKTLGDPDPQVRSAGLDALQKAIHDCKALGGASVMLVPAVVNAKTSYADAYARSQEEIRKALPLAEELGVKIGIENVWNGFLLSPLEAARYIDEFNSPAIGWCLDIGNVVAWGWPEQWVRILSKRIIKLHVKDYSRRKRDEEGLSKGFDVELMEGDVDWPAVMKALGDVGYKGWMVAEVKGGALDRIKFLAQRMRKIIAS